MEFLLLLGTPLLGALVLGRYGARRAAPELNVLFSGRDLHRRLRADRARHRRTAAWLVAHEQFFIDPFNVFLVTLTAFVGLTTALFSRPYMRVEIDARPAEPRPPAAVSTACTSCSPSRCCWR